jgi:hypothetical protein
MAAVADRLPLAVRRSSSTAPLLALLRRLDRFRASYDPAHLDTAEADLRALLGEHAADLVMREAVLFDNELRLRTGGRLVFARLGSSGTTRDESTLLALLAAAQAGRLHEAAEHALALGIVRSRELVSIAERLGDRLDEAGLALASAAGWTIASPATPATTSRFGQASRL